MINRLIEKMAPRHTGPVNYLMGIFCYLGMLCFIPLLFSRRDPFIHFHCRQGLVIWIFLMIGLFSVHLPGIGGFIFGATHLFGLIFSIVGMISILLGRYTHIPGVHLLSCKL